MEHILVALQGTRDLAAEAQLVLRALSRDPDGRYGISRPFDSLSAAPAARREAELALACLPVGARGSHTYGASPAALLIAASPQSAREFAGSVLGAMLALPGTEADLLIGTLRAWFEHGGSTPAAAAALHCHRNTVLYRLNRIAALTGRAVSDPANCAELFLAVRTLDQTGLAPPAGTRAATHRAGSGTPSRAR